MLLEQTAVVYGLGMLGFCANNARIASCRKRVNSTTRASCASPERLLRQTVRRISSHVVVQRSDKRSVIGANFAMAALPPKADMCGATRDVRFGPKADITSLIDHIISAG